MRFPSASAGVVVCVLGCGGGLGTAAVPPSDGVLESVQVERSTSGLTIRLVASANISGVLHRLDEPRRLYLDLAGVVPRVPRVISVNHAGVHQIRVGLNSMRPLVTRLVLDLSGEGSYELQPGLSRRELRLTVAEWGRPLPRPNEGPQSDLEARLNHGSTTSYIAWFGSTAARAGELLDQSAALPPSKQSVSMLARLRAEWSAIPREVQTTKPPEGFAAEHELLLASVRLGEVALARRAESSRLAAEASAGEAGAAMLIARAREQIGKASSRIGHVERH